MLAKCIMTLAITLMLATMPAGAQQPTDAAYLQGKVNALPKKKPGKLDVSDASVLKFTWDKGSWSVPFGRIKTIYVSLSRRSVMAEAFGVYGVPAAVAKKRKLLLSLMLTDEEGRNQNCVFFLPYAASQKFLTTLQTKSGGKIVYESEEARQTTEDRE
jgi:hypothetical protein